MIYILHTCLPRWDLHDLEILHTCLRWWDLYDLYDLHIHAYLDGIYMICMICTRFSGEDLYDLDLMHNFSLSAKKDLMVCPRWCAFFFFKGQSMLRFFVWS